ncbi:MAG: ExeM/NucH family extracellular endonuclease [Pseudomonadota bacterium]
MSRFPKFVFGSFRDDTLVGTGGRDFITGLFGDDTISAGAGNDTIFAGWGDDVVRGGAGRDRIDGGRGIDTAVYAGGVDDYAVSTGRGRVTVESLSDAGDVDRLRAVERLYFEADDYTADLTGANNAVLARDDARDATAAGAVILSGLLDNDFDFDGDALTITALDTADLAGTAVLNADGTVTYDAAGAFDALAAGETATTVLRYTVSDGNGSNDTAEVVLTVTGTNDAPVLTVDGAVSVAENGTDVLVATAADVDGDAVTFSLGGADAALFEIGADGALRFAAAPDFEAPGDADGDNIYEVTVIATDTGGASDSQDVAVTVTDLDEAPALRINEIHYDNVGADEGEFVEVAGAPGTSLEGWSIVLYNGNGGAPYGTIDLSGALNADGVAAFARAGIQNGEPDGLALVDPDGAVVEFLSYEGTFEAVGGLADGLTSVDIGVAEEGDTPVGQSLQRQADGTWAGPSAATPGAANDGDGGTGGGGGGDVAEALEIVELHYDNVGGDEGEFVEVAGEAGASLEGWSLVLYNGNNGEAYNTIPLSGVLNEDGVAAFDAAGIQNGGADGIALVRPNGTVEEFLSYEGTLTAVGGPADGLTSTDIGVAETGSTPVGQSLQKIGDDWIGPIAASRGAANEAGGGGGGEEPEAVLISQVQGAGAASTLIDRLVSVEAVVTATLADGFFLQEEDADADGDAATSEGVFVFTGGAPEVTVGDIVFAEGTVAEFFDATQIAADLVEVRGTADLPSAAGLTLPFTLETDLEAVEGMLVSVTSEAAPLTVIENFNFDRFGQITISAGEQIQPTQIFDAQTEAEEVAALDAANALNRIAVDDGVSTQNPDSFAYIGNDTAGDDGDGILSAGDDFSQGNPAPRLGAQLDGALEGVLSFTFGEYRVIPTEVLPIDPATNDGAREATPPEVDGELKVVSFNALNYFTTLGERGATTEADLARQTEKLVNALVALDGDVVGLQEIENNGFGEDSAIAALVDAVNARLGDEVYAFVDPTEDGGLIGSDAITTGLIYKTDSVTEIASDTFAFNEEGERQLNRPATVAAFEDTDGGVITIANNHFKSKGPSGVEADDPNADQGDGQGNWNVARTEAAEALTAWLATDPLGVGDPDVLIIGDLNAYSQEDPIQAIETAGYDNLLEEFVGAEDAFSFVFSGERGALDHAMSTESLRGQVIDVDEWNINSQEPDLLSYDSEFTDAGFYDGTTPFGASDHDPLIVGLTLTPSSDDPIG